MSKVKQQLDFDSITKDFIKQHNHLRTNPTTFIEHLEKLLTLFKGDILYRLGEIPIKTNDGKHAVEEAIEFLRKQEPVPELELCESLCSAAKDHCLDIGSKGLVTHDGTDNSNVSDRIERYGEWEITCAENIDFGNKTGLDCVISLLVDDGVCNRGHRMNLFNKRLTHFGLHLGTHKEYETCLVVDYTGGLREKDKPFFDYTNFKYQYPENLEKKPVRKNNKPKNSYQLDDNDAPDDTVSVKVVKQTKLYEGRVHRVTKKFYTLADGSTSIVEVEDA